MSPTRSRTSRRASGCSATRRSCPSTRGSGARSSISGRSRGDFRRRPGSAREGAPRADAAPGRRARGRPGPEPGRGANAEDPRRADRYRATRARPDGHARLGDGGGRLLQHPGGAREGGPPRQARPVARRAVAHDGQPELHVLPQARRSLPQRARAPGGRRQVRLRARDEPGDEAPAPRVLRGDRRHHRQGRLHDHVLAQEPQRELHPQPGAPGLGDLPARGRRHAEERPRGHRPVQARGVGTRRPDRADAEPRLPRQGAAPPRPGRVPLHPRSERDPGRAQGGRHRRVALRPRSRARAGGAEGRALPGRRRGHDERRDPGDEQLAQALRGRARAARDHPRDQQAGRPPGRDVRIGPDPRLERGPAEPVLRRRVRPHAVRPGEGEEAPRRGGLPERLRDRAEGRAEEWDIENYAKPTYYFRYDSPEFQTLFKESEVTLDDKARRELYARMQKKLVEDAPVVWLYMHPRLVVAKKGVAGLWKDLPVPSADLAEVAWAK